MYGSYTASRPKNKLYVMLAVCLLVAVTIATAVTKSAQARVMREVLDAVQPEKVYVKEGDTLWLLAERYGIEGVSTPEVVAWMRAQNNLESPIIVAGQSLLVP